MSIDIPENSKQILKELLDSEIKRLSNKISTLSEELKIYEDKYKMKSDAFIDSFNSGDLGDNEDYFSWYAIYDIMLQVKIKLDSLESIKVV